MMLLVCPYVGRPYVGVANRRTWFVLCRGPRASWQHTMGLHVAGLCHVCHCLGRLFFWWQLDTNGGNGSLAHIMDAAGLLPVVFAPPPPVRLVANPWKPDRGNGIHQCVARRARCCMILPGGVHYRLGLVPSVAFPVVSDMLRAPCPLFMPLLCHNAFDRTVLRNPF